LHVEFCNFFTVPQCRCHQIYPSSSSIILEAAEMSCHTTDAPAACVLSVLGTVADTRFTMTPRSQYRANMLLLLLLLYMHSSGGRGGG